jgi:ubiquinone/menaquinone biosynthesis C-methylase UbiE
MEKDLQVIKEHWEKKKTTSLRDLNLQLLEREVIINFIKKSGKSILKDIGCGDGSDTVHFSKYVDQVYAYDYSSAMIDKASDNLSSIDTVHLGKLDIINEKIEQTSDLVLTKRTLINLGSFERQKAAINKIHNSIEKNGFFIMLETSVEGLINLNSYRSKFGLSVIPEPFHNTLFKLDELKSFLREYFVIEDIKYFSTYFFLTRVYNFLLEGENSYKYDVFARSIEEHNINLFDSEIIGPQFCMLLRKK